MENGDTVESAHAEQNARIDALMRPLLDQISAVRSRISAATRRTNPWTECTWHEDLPSRDPLLVELAAVEAELTRLRDSRPIHPIHAWVRREIVAAINGQPSDPAVLDLLVGDLEK